MLVPQRFDIASYYPSGQALLKQEPDWEPFGGPVSFGER